MEWWVRVNINDVNSVYDPELSNIHVYDPTFSLQGWEKGDVIPHCWVRAQSVSTETSRSLVTSFRGSRSEAWIPCVTMCVTFFSTLSSKGRTASWCWDSAKSSTNVTPKNLRMGTLRHTPDFSQWKPNVPIFFFSNRYLIIFPVSEVWKNQLRMDPWFFSATKRIAMLVSSLFFIFTAI